VIEFDDPPNLEPGEIKEIFEDPKWSSGYFKLLSDYLRGPSYTETNPPVLLEGGEEFAWTLAYIMTAEPERFREIMDALRDVVPVVKKVRARPARITRVERKTVTIEDQKGTFSEERTVMGQELIFDMVSGEGLPATYVSDGTLIVLAILTAIIQGNSGAKTILLDDIEQGLHPKAQRDLIRQLRKLQEVRPELQIIVSSHSPYVIDELSPGDVWLFAPDKEGCAAYARLSDHPDVDRALKVLTTGEFWSSEGEEWVLDPQKWVRHREEQPAI
jgi:predicted ATPase